MNINQFLSEHSYLIEYVTIFIYVIFSVLLFRKTGDIKYLKGVCEEMVKYRNEHYKDTLTEDEKKNSVVQLNCLKKVYRLNKVSGELEDTGEVIDINDVVSSFEAQTLERIYQRFFPVTDESNVVDEYNQAIDDLDEMQNAFALAESYRQKYNLPNDMHFSQVLSEVDRRSKDLKSKIQVAEQVKKGVENAKEIEQESEQA